MQQPLLQPEQQGGMEMSHPQHRKPRLEDTAVDPGRPWCSPCCFQRGKNRLSPESCNDLWKLRNEHCNEPFDKESKEAHRLFIESWNSAFPAETIDKVERSERWPRLGFQSQDPTTDVRTGIFALKQFHYFLRTYPDRAQQIARQAEEFEYPLAITSFNLTHMVVVFFDLFNSETVSPISGAQQANLLQLENFTGLCIAETSPRIVVDELLCVLLERFHETWKHMRATENVNMMDLPKAMRKLYDVHSSFWKSPRKRMAELRFMLSEPQ